MDSIIKTVLDGDFNELKKHCDVAAAEKVNTRIQNKKIEVLANMNGVDVDKMKEIMNIKSDEE